MSGRGSRAVSILLAMVLAFGMLLVGRTPAQATAVPAPPRTDAELQALIEPIVAAGAPGSAALVREGHAVREAASGVANLQTGRPMDPDLNYRVGSITKPFVATVILQLVGEGRLSLSDTVERWLPGVLPYGDQITIRQLLSMTSGVPEYIVTPILELYASDAGRYRAWSPEELVALIADQPLRFPPGMGFEYSNTNYVLVGMVIEAVTGRSLDDEVTRRILRPLRLHDTFFPVDWPGIPGRSAHGYSLPLSPEEGPVLDGPLLDYTVYNPSFTWAAGNLVSDLDDVTRFLRALLGGRLLSPELLAEMMTPVDAGEADAFYGLGLMSIPTPCGTLYGHDGALPGFLDFALSTEDGGRQFGLMLNVYWATPAVLDAYSQTVVQFMMEVFEGVPCDPAAAAASVQAAVRAVDAEHTAQLLAGAR